MTSQQALERLQVACSKAEYCSGQIKRKLLRWRQKDLLEGRAGFSDEQIEEIINKLVGDRYVDEARFAGAYVRDKARFSKWGKVKIAYNLRNMGVSEHIISSSLAENEALLGGDTLDQLLERKYKQLKESDSVDVKKQKLIRFALGRGFEYNQIISKIKNLI